MTNNSITPPIRISVPPNTRAYRIERNSVGRIEDIGSWVLWLHPAPDFNSGTYLKLYDDGSMYRVTLYPDGSEDMMLLKGADFGSQK
jgi:hypothetical protein